MTRFKHLRALLCTTSGVAALAAGLVVGAAGPAAAADGISVTNVSLHQNGSDGEQFVSVSGSVVGTSGTLVTTVKIAPGILSDVMKGFNIDSSTNATCTESLAPSAFEIDCTSTSWGAGDLDVYLNVGGGEEGPVFVSSCSQNPVATTTAEYAGESSTRAVGTATDVDCTSATSPPAVKTSSPKPTTAAAAAKTTAPSHSKTATAAPTTTSTPASAIASAAASATDSDTAAALAGGPTDQTSVSADGIVAGATLSATQPSSAAHSSSIWPIIGIVVVLILAVGAAGWYFVRRRRLATAATAATAASAPEAEPGEGTTRR